MTPRYVTASAAARLLGVTDKTVRSWIAAGKLDAHHPARNRLAILLEDVNRLARERALYQEEAPGGQGDDLRARLAALEVKYQELEERLARMTVGPPEMFSAGAGSRAEKRPVQSLAKNQQYAGGVKLRGVTLPPGAELASHFAERHGVNPNTFRDHYTKGRVEISSMRTPNRNSKTWYITDEDAQRVYAFWNEQGIPYTLPEHEEE